MISMTTQKFDEIKKFNSQQIRYKSTRELTEEEIKEKKKKKKARMAERRRKREEGEAVTSTDDETTWSQDPFKKDTFGIPWNI